MSLIILRNLSALMSCALLASCFGSGGGGGGGGGGSSSPPLALTLPTSQAFGSTTNGEYTEKTITVTKTGSGDITGVSETTMAAPFQFAGGTYPGSGGTCASTITANCTLVVRFYPTADSGSFSQTLTLQYTAGTTKSVNMILQGFALPDPSTDDLSISDGSTFDYGTISVNATSDKTFTVTNNSSTFEATDLAGSGLTAPYSFKGGTFPGTGGTCTNGGSLAASGNCTIVVSYSPSSGSASDSDTVLVDYTMDSNSRQTQRDVTGQTGAWLTISDGGTYNYGNKAPNSTTDYTFTVTNSGGASATSLSENADALAAPFSFNGGFPGSGASCTNGGSIAAAGACTVVVRYNPTATGAHEDIFYIDYGDSADSPTTQTANRTVAGTGTNPSVEFTSTSTSDSEGTTTHTVNVSMDIEDVATVTVDYAVTGGTATGSGTDYTLASGTLTFTAGDTSEDISISINNDSIDEDNETIQITLSNVTGGSSVLGTDSVDTHTINDDDDPPTVSFDSSSSNGFESTTAVNFGTSLSLQSGKTVTVDYSVTGGTATGSGTDYTLASGTLTFTPGDTAENIAATIIDDRVVESAGETFTVTLSNPGNATLGGTTSHTYTINDDSIPSGILFLQGTQTTSSTNLNQSTAYAIEWSSGWNDSATYTHSTSTNPETITIDTAGDYFISVSIPLSSTDIYTNLLADIRVNGTSVNDGRFSSGFIRDQHGHQESSLNIAMLLDGLSATDTVDVVVQQEAAAGTVTITSAASIYIEKVDAARTIFYGTATQTTDSTNLNQATAFALEWTEIIEDTGFTHGAGSQSITLDNGGNYLVSLNIPMTSTVSDANVNFTINVNGSAVTGGQASQGYMSNVSGHDHASAHWSGMLYNLSATDTLTVETQIEGNTGTVTVDSAKVASIFIEEVNTASNHLMVRANALVSGTDWNPTTASEITWTAEDIKDAAVYTHNTGSSPEDITVQSAGDYLLIYNDSMTGTTTNSANKIRVLVDGVAETGGEVKTHYLSSSNGHNESSASLVWLLRDLKVGNVISLDSAQEARLATIDDLDDAILLLIKK